MYIERNPRPSLVGERYNKFRSSQCDGESHEIPRPDGVHSAGHRGAKLHKRRSLEPFHTPGPTHMALLPSTRFFTGRRSWNVSGTSPEQSAAAAAAGVAGAEDLDGSPLVYYDKLFPSTLVGDIPSQMAVYQIGAVLLPYNMTALGGMSQSSSTSGASNGTASQPTPGKGTSKPSGAAAFLAAVIGLIMPLLALTI
ncbi:unnamed protein product [Closterium sp. Yama58-4]|nr:unnamed protein product [Closterium sp. Yama58-4]